MTLATVNQHYEVTARVVLLKQVNEQGFVFFTNYESTKGQQLFEVKQAALVFWWPKCQRQVRITGVVDKVSREDSERYFKERSEGSQVAAIISKQSTPIPDRDYLIEKYEDFMIKNNNKEIHCPVFWGGYILKPDKIEFWQGREHRLHDRFLYTRSGATWVVTQLAP